METVGEVQEEPRDAAHPFSICSYNVCIIALCFALTANTTSSHTHTETCTHTQKKLN